jgi:hypothetical protein
MSNNPWENDATLTDSAPWESDSANQSSAYVPMSAASSLPPTWSPTVQGQKVRTSYDPQAKGYLTTGANGAELMVVRHPDGGLMLTKYARPKIDPTEDMSAFKTGAAGAGKVLSDTGRGIVQLGTLAGNTLGLVSDEAVDKSFEREREVAEQDQALMDTTAGKFGYGVGLIGTAVTPGVLLKGAGLAAKGAGLAATGAALDTAGTAVLAPQTYKGAMALGATQGAVLPSESYEGKALNVGVGAAGGAAGQLVGNTLGKGLNKVQASQIAKKEAETIAQGRTLPPVLDRNIQVLLNANGIDVGRMARETQRGIQNVVNNSKNITPESIVRIARAESLKEPVKLTQGSALGDFKQQQAESMLERLPQGVSIRIARDDANAALVKNLEGVTDSQGALAANPYDMGKSIQGALKKGADVNMAKIGKMYDNANAQGQQNIVDPTPMINGLMKNIDAIQAGNDAGPALTMANTLKRLGLMKVNQITGDFEPTGNLMTAQQAMELYKSANKNYVKGATSSIHMSDFKRGIIDALDQTPAGDLFKEATRSFKNHARTYDDPKLVSALLKVGADDTPAIAAEKIFDRIVMKGSIDDINNLKSVILGSDKSVRQQGLESLKNMRAATSNYLLEKSFMGNAINETGERVVSGSNLINAVKQLGGGGSAKNEELGWLKIKAIMGTKATQELKNIASVSLDATRKVRGAAETSGTAERLISLLGSMPLNIGKPVQMVANAAMTGVKNEGQRQEAKQAVNAVTELMKKKATAVPVTALGASSSGQAANR